MGFHPPKHRKTLSRSPLDPLPPPFELQPSVDPSASRLFSAASVRGCDWLFSAAGFIDDLDVRCPEVVVGKSASWVGQRKKLEALEVTEQNSMVDQVLLGALSWVRSALNPHPSVEP